jgi:PAS domain S-box-containing protein
MKATRNYKAEYTIGFKELLRNGNELIIPDQIIEDMRKNSWMNYQPDPERKITDMELGEPRYRELVENASDLIYELDANGTFTFANQIMEQMVGYNKEELYTKMYWELVHPDHREKVVQFYTQQRKNRQESSYLEFIMLSQNGNKVWIGQSVRMFFQENGYVYRVHAISRNITALKNTEQLLETSEKKFRILSEHAPVGIFQTNAVGKINYVNKEWCEITGLSQEEALGENWTHAIHEADRAEFLKMWIQAFTDQREFNWKFRWIHKNQKIKWIIGRVLQLPGMSEEEIGYIGTFNDITELVEVHQQLAKREELYRLLSTNTNDLISLFKADAKATRIFVSPSVHDILGYDAEELLGRSPLEIIHPDDIDEVLAKTNAFTLNGKSATIEYRVLTKAKNYIWLESNTQPYFDSNGNMLGFQSTARDITRRKTYESTLKIAKVRAEEAALAKSQFLSLMSHEIRTPMIAVIGLTDMLIKQDPRLDQREYLDLLKYSGENLLKIINDVLDFSKIEAGKVELENEEFNLPVLIGMTKGVLEHKAEEKGSKLELIYNTSLPQFVKGDSIRLGQVITNLLGNAIKFTEKGIIRIVVTNEGVENDKRKIRFEINDTGIGIESDKLDSIFERFTQASHDTSRKYGGTGLGLSIANDLVKLMGSKIEVTSQPGVGSSFSFSILMEEVNKVTTPSILHEPKVLPIYVLLVDDNDINRLIASNFLNRCGIFVDQAKNGKEALEQIQSRKYKLVLMDLQMPEMDGYEATRRIREFSDEYFKKIPILALTASTPADIRTRAREAGLNDLINKPFVPEQLYSKVKEYVFFDKPPMP